jgi:FdhD protein
VSRDTDRIAQSVSTRAENSVTYVRYEGGEGKRMARPLVREAPWTIHVDGQEVVTLYCTPDKLNFLALGFLAAEGIIDSLADVLLLQVCEDQEGVINVTLNGRDLSLRGRPIVLSGCGRGITFDDLSASHPALESSLQIPATQISGLMRDLRHEAEIHQSVGGTHASALADESALLVVAEDVGRHNTLDKIRGECLFRGIPTRDRMLLTTGRVSSEMVAKAVKMEVPIVASRSTPTDLAVELARDWEMTVVGYVRGDRLNVYTRPDRVTAR